MICLDKRRAGFASSLAGCARLAKVSTSIPAWCLPGAAGLLKQKPTGQGGLGKLGVKRRSLWTFCCLSFSLILLRKGAQSSGFNDICSLDARGGDNQFRFPGSSVTKTEATGTTRLIRVLLQRVIELLQSIPVINVEPKHT